MLQNVRSCRIKSEMRRILQNELTVPVFGQIGAAKISSKHLSFQFGVAVCWPAVTNLQIYLIWKIFRFVYLFINHLSIH